MISLTKDKRMLGYEALAPYPDISCFVTTRHGGCSTGNYASFNCTPYTGDHPDCVRKNQELQGVDALITRTPGCCICISTADCIPILLYDKEHHAIAAVHAGWRGTVRHILAHTLRRMQATCGTEGKDIIACIGPGISFASFEVGDEVHEAFRAEGFPMEQISAWKPETHKYHIDLWKANHLQLSDFGVPSRQIETAGICTYRQHEDFFSARRLGIKSGRILSGIMLNG